MSASYDNTLRLWDVATGHTLATWTDHAGPVLACTFSPDGTQALSTGADGTVRCRDLATGELLWVAQTLRDGEHATWAPDTPHDRVVEASPGAWRYLGWQRRDADDRIIDVVPAEHYGRLLPPALLTS